MTQIKISKETASSQYEKAISEIQNELIELNRKLKRHKALQKMNQDNWGYVGDAGHILGQLKNINSFLNP